MMRPEHLVHEHVIDALVFYHLTGLESRAVLAGFHIRMVRTDHRALVFAEDDQFAPAGLAFRSLADLNSQADAYACGQPCCDDCVLCCSHTSPFPHLSICGDAPTDLASVERRIVRETRHTQTTLSPNRASFVRNSFLAHHGLTPSGSGGEDKVDRLSSTTKYGSPHFSGTLACYLIELPNLPFPHPSPNSTPAPQFPQGAICACQCLFCAS